MIEKPICMCCNKLAVVYDDGFPYCGNCYCKKEKIGKYENPKQNIKDNRKDNCVFNLVKIF